ncbi:polyprenyl synthetase family protein [Kribbella deserti]|uniref:Polyprenyl synthetase family protein n=1 Tax=Kribbella deserti TaxID=1926257 RepID=A0ABV6QP81_9ACTN
MVTRQGPARSIAVVGSRQTDDVIDWLGVRVAAAKATVSAYAGQRCTEYFTAPETAVLREVLPEFVAEGKYVRSTFAYLGWLCGQAESAAAAEAVAGLELLHAFALIQDDVMDDSATRRGRPTVHVRLANWHTARAATSDRRVSDRFGRSAAVLLGDLCLIWAERMLREADLPAASLDRAWPVYDLMRSELAVGQFSDLLNDLTQEPELATVLDIARRKSGNYTVRRPLELGAALAGCDRRTTRALQRYGSMVGEAYQLRDDHLGVFGEPRMTGKPLGDDLREGKATTLLVVARDLASPGQRAEMADLARRTPAPEDPATDEWVRRWQELIVATGADARIEQLIAERVDAAIELLSRAELPTRPYDALVLLAGRCTNRDH